MWPGRHSGRIQAWTPRAPLLVLFPSLTDPTEERQATAARPLLESAKKTKIQLSKFNDFIGFIESFMNRRASHLANIIERYSEELYEMESFYRQKKGGTRNLKECITLGKATIL